MKELRCERCGEVMKRATTIDAIPSYKRHRCKNGHELFVEDSFDDNEEDKERKLMRKNDIEISGMIIKDTKYAILFNDGEVEVWIPKSQISNLESINLEEDKDAQDLEVPEWLARRNGLI